MWNFSMRLRVTVACLACLTGCVEVRPLDFDGIFVEERRIYLDPRDDFLVGPLPRIGTVTLRGHIVILDVTPRVGIYDKSGAGMGIIGGVGDGPGEYRYPLSLASYDGDLYLYDNMLSRLSRYDDSYDFVSSVLVSEHLNEIQITTDGRLYGYWSTNPTELVCELDKQGRVLSRFAPQSKNYNAATNSFGGGVVLSNGFLFTISPYEYVLSKYSLDGVLIDTVQGHSELYVPPPEKFDERILNDIPRLNEFHDQWSHILQVLRIGDRGLGVVFAEPGYSRTYLDIYDTNLNMIAEEILLPDYMNSPRALFTREDRLYMLVEPVDDQANPAVIVYVLRRSFNAF